MALWVFHTCPPVDLSTCLPGLTGPEVNIGVQGIMGIPYLFTCRPVNLSSCPSRLTGPEIKRGVKGIMVDRSTGGQVRNTHNAFFP